MFCVDLINEVRMAKTLVIYGWAFSSTMGDDRETLEQYGEFPNSINLRQMQVIVDDFSWENTKSFIFQHYCEHSEKSKEDILKITKDLRKMFMKRIAEKLKLLGFKKKGNEWYYLLNNGFKLMFYADKDTYSDVYSFDLNIISNQYPDNSTGCYPCYSNGLWFEDNTKYDWRLSPSNIDFSKFDWQLDSMDLLEERLDYMIRNQIIPIINIDLTDVGKLEWIRECCYCKEPKCSDCWMTF